MSLDWKDKWKQIPIQSFDSAEISKNKMTISERLFTIFIWVETALFSLLYSFHIQMGQNF